MTMTVINVNEPEEPASESLQNERQLICNDCENYNAENDSCSQCECIIARKKFYLHSLCPIGKW